MLWRSSSLRITFAVMVTFLLASFLIVGLIYWRTSQVLVQRDLATVLDEARALSVVAAREGTTALASRLRGRRLETALFYGLTAADGRQAWLSGFGTWPSELAQDNKTAFFNYQRPQSDIAQTRRGGEGQLQSTAIGVTLRLPDGARLLVARDTSEQRELVGVIRSWFLAALAVLTGLAVIAAWVLNRLLLARIGAITETANGIMSGDMARRIPLSASEDEFDDLAGSLNTMLDRIEELMRGLREVSDNIAHDLKTPLNRLRIRAEEALRDSRGDFACREGLETVLVDADELIRTFNALLRVARLEAGTLGNNAETFDATELVRDLAEFYEPVAEEAEAQIVVSGDQRATLTADRQLVSQALTNLLENAIKYGVDADAAASLRVIELGARAAGQGIELWVGDRGNGIAKADVERVLKRFVRLDAARSKPGTGLGLSLVAAVVRQHGGSIELLDNRPGLKVVLKLPAALTDHKASKDGGTEQQTRMVETV